MDKKQFKCRDRLLRYAATLGSTGVTAGAFGAHALKHFIATRTDTNHRFSSLQDNWKTAVQYQLFHAASLVALASLAHVVEQQDDGLEKCSKEESPSTYRCTLMDRIYVGGKLMFYGTVLFSGSIFFLCLGIGPRKILGPITPLGGSFMIGGWIFIGLITFIK